VKLLHLVGWFIWMVWWCTGLRTSILQNLRKIAAILWNKTRPTPGSRVLLQMLILPHLLKKIPSFYEARKFISVFTRGRHLSYPKLCQSSSSPSLPISGRSIPMLSSQVPMRLPSRLFPLELPTPHQIALCTSHEQRNKPSVFIKGGIFPAT